MEIYLIRHGDCYPSSMEYFCSEKQTMNPPLTPKGIRQAHQLAERLKGIPFDKIFSSDLDRAIQTSEIINSTVKSNITVTKQFREIDMGDIYRKPWSDYPDLYSQWILHEEDIPYPNGENGSDVWNRCKEELDSIIQSDYTRLAIVCHGGTLRSIICGILNIPQQKRFYFGHPPENCSISVLVRKNSDFFLHSFNDYSHITM